MAYGLKKDETQIKIGGIEEVGPELEKNTGRRPTEWMEEHAPADVRKEA